MGPVEFNKVVRVADDVVRGGLDPFQPRLGRYGLEAHDAPAAFDLDRLTGGQDLIEDRVDVGAKLRGGDLHAFRIPWGTYVRNGTYIPLHARRGVRALSTPSIQNAVSRLSSRETKKAHRSSMGLLLRWIASSPHAPLSSNVHVIGIFASSESRTEQYFVTANSIARSACCRSTSAPVMK